MSTHDVPGANPVNADELHTGCWAEHADGSLIFVEGNEGGQVVYSIFDVGMSPPMEYRDVMEEKDFKELFTFESNPGKKKKKQNEKWTWHDKTTFPWDRVLSTFRTGSRHVDADDQRSAAERVAESLRLRGRKLDRDLSHLREHVVQRSATMWDKLGRAIEELRK